MAREGRQNADPVLIVALAAGATKQQAAEQAEVSPRTVARRWADPTFRQAVADAQAETVKQVAARLSAAGMLATATLLRLLKAESESVQLGAARSILELGVKFRESAEIETRIVALEERLSQPEGPTRWAS